MSTEDRTSWALLALLAVAQFMVVLDITIVNVALPSIGAGLGFAPADLQWVVTAYVLCSGGLLLVGGRAADLIGRRRTFLAGLAVFTGASLACGLAPSPGFLVAARAVQGMGAALLTPSALSIVTSTYTGAQRVTALSLWGAIASGGIGVGVLLGGVLTSALSWHWVFLVNVPVGLTAALLVPRIVPPLPGRGRRSLDLPGGLTAVAGLAVLVYALSGAPEHGWGSARTLLLLVLAAALLTSFALLERVAPEPLVAPSTWRIGSLVSGSTMMLGATGIMAGAFFLNSLHLQNELGFSALETGLAFLPFVAAIMLGVHATSRAIGRLGSRALIVLGMIFVTAGALLFAVAHDSYGELLPGFLILGVGVGLAFPAISITAMSDVPHESSGTGSGVMSTFHEVGAALGVAALSAIAFGSDYQAAAIGAAIAGAGLTVLAATLVPAVRPAPGAHAMMH
jgi:EmrB/QacA subfamily drug resistance transporter